MQSKSLSCKILTAYSSFESCVVSATQVPLSRAMHAFSLLGPDEPSICTRLEIQKGNLNLASR